MTQREITRPTPLLGPDGRLLRPGYARQMYYRYNRHHVAAGPFALKEWDFYQLALGNWVLQMTIGHVSYMASFSATLFSLENGQRHSFGHMRPLPLRSLNMPLDPNRPHRLCAKGPCFHMVFEVEKGRRTLSLQAKGKQGPVDICMVLPHRRGDEAMVIATPFDEPEQFYLNCKEHFYGVRGYARFGGTRVEATGSETALLDWGRGVWPFHQQWFWGCGAGNMAGGRFGFNLGWGFGNLANATENMFFWNGKAHKLGELLVDRDPQNLMAPWRFTSPDGRFDLGMAPVYDNYTETKLAFVDNCCHQVFGSFSGHAVLPDGKIIQVKDLLAFCEHAENNW